MAQTRRYNKPGPDDYETDPTFYQVLNREFNFGLDAAASDYNAKCKKFFSKEDNALSKDWAGVSKSIFLNPPYGVGVAASFLQKAYEESIKGATVVCLVHAVTDTIWFHDLVFGRAAEVRFIKRRLNFWRNNKKNTSHLPHVLVVYKPGNEGPACCFPWDWRYNGLFAFNGKSL